MGIWGHPIEKINYLNNLIMINGTMGGIMSMLSSGGGYGQLNPFSGAFGQGVAGGATNLIAQGQVQAPNKFSSLANKFAQLNQARVDEMDPMDSLMSDVSDMHELADPVQEDLMVADEAAMIEDAAIEEALVDDTSTSSITAPDAAAIQSVNPFTGSNAMIGGLAGAAIGSSGGGRLASLIANKGRLSESANAAKAKRAERLAKIASGGLSKLLKKKGVMGAAGKIGKFAKKGGLLGALASKLRKKNKPAFKKMVGGGSGVIGGVAGQAVQGGMGGIMSRMF